MKTNDEIRALTDPYRTEIMQVMRRNDRKPMTVKQIAKVMNEPHGKVYYHIKKLEQFNAVRLEKTEKINGIIAKYYVLDFERLVLAKKYDDESNDLALDSLSSVIKKYFDDNRDQFLHYLRNINRYMEAFDEETRRKVEEDENSVIKDAFVQNTNLYFTEEEYWEFKKTIRKFIKEHSGEQPDERYLKKSIFFAVSNIFEEPKN